MKLLSSVLPHGIHDSTLDQWSTEQCICNHNEHLLVQPQHNRHSTQLHGKRNKFLLLRLKMFQKAVVVQVSCYVPSWDSRGVARAKLWENMQLPARHQHLSWCAGVVCLCRHGSAVTYQSGGYPDFHCVVAVWPQGVLFHKSKSTESDRYSDNIIMGWLRIPHSSDWEVSYPSLRIRYRCLPFTNGTLSHFNFAHLQLTCNQQDKTTKPTSLLSVLLLTTSTLVPIRWI